MTVSNRTRSKAGNYTEAGVSKRKLRSGGESEEHHKGPLLCLAFGEHIFSPEGWILGSAADTDTCDLQLAKDNTTGISRRHFRIDTHPITCNPRLTVLFAGAIRLVDEDCMVSLCQGRSIDISRMATIDFGAITTEDEMYRRKALDWSREVLASLPRSFPPLNAKGTTASVMLVEERISGAVFGAKEPYYNTNGDFGKVRNRWEELRREYENHHIRSYEQLLFASVLW
ncbi:hypothetical protein GGS23DRAFT_605630 [Durotheca rogersii]|uniref:uncharacterized protein n=1 Tax=Durotheca rogersii TaxID=419775 RepID=UPI0022209C5E|nr:uncharacterized protein GGS23DRAFT_605630 [Durotheca rogersii]KAI5862315.1 hypothetical protein GGS23DRAFT_605630 [Durotheca rogersii]